MTTVLTPTPPVRFIVNRLRQSLADPSLWPDAELLALISEAHGSICQSLRWNRVVDSFPLIAEQQEYPLPTRLSRLERVYMNGARLVPVPFTDVMLGQSNAYYQVGPTIGFVTAPLSAGVAWIYYAQQPLALGMDDTPLIPPECYYLLRHYAAWRILLVQGGAQSLATAARQLALFQRGVKRLRGEMQPLGEASAQILQVAWEHAR